MMKYTKTSATLAVAATMALAGAAQADGFTYYGIEITEDRLTFEGDWFGIRQIDAAADYKMGSFLATVDIAQTQFRSSDGGPNSDPERATTIALGYYITPELLAGLAVTSFSEFDENANSVFAEYNNGQMVAGLALTDTDGQRNTTIYGEYQVSDDLSFGVVVDKFEDEDAVTFVQVDYGMGDIEVGGSYLTFGGDDGIVTVDASYGFGNGLRATGVYSTIVGADFDLNQIDIGASYEFAPGAMIEASIGRLSGDGVPDDVGTISIGLTFERGNRAIVGERLRDDARRARFNTLFF